MSLSILSEKKIWITGASRGIGLATAELLASSGAVVFASSSNAEDLKNKFKALSKLQEIIPIKCDVSNKNDIVKAYKSIKDYYGVPDILINNAGVGIFKPFLDTDYEDFTKIIDVNLKGPFLTEKAILPDMIERKSGVIMNILSVAVNSTFLNSSVYSASKAGLLTMDRILREEVRKYGIKIIDMLPGATISGIWSDEDIAINGFRMMKPIDMALAIKNTLELSYLGNLMVEEIIIKPQLGDL